MFNYEDNEKVVNKAIFKCLSERFEFGGFDEPESFSGNTTGGMSIKEGYEISKKIDIIFEITSRDNNKVVGNVFARNPKTDELMDFSGVGFVLITADADNPVGYLADDYPELTGDWMIYCPDNNDNYALYNDIIMPLVKNDIVKGIKLLTKLVKRGTISVPNPFFKKRFSEIF